MPFCTVCSKYCKSEDGLMRHQLQSEKCRVLQETRTTDPPTSQSSRSRIPREIALNHHHSDNTEEHEPASPVVNSPSPSVRTIIADELVPTQRSRYSLRERTSIMIDTNQRSTTSQQQSQEPSAPNAAAPAGFYRPPEDWPDGISVLHENPNLNEEHWWEDLNSMRNDMRNDNEDSYEDESNSNLSSSSNSHHGGNADNNSVQDDQAAVVAPPAGSSSQQNYPNVLVLTQPIAATTYAGTRTTSEVTII